MSLSNIITDKQFWHIGKFLLLMIEFWKLFFITAVTCRYKITRYWPCHEV